MRRLANWWAGHQQNPDPLVAAGNLFAMAVGGNQPFYPLYAYLVVGGHAWPALAGIVSMPLFFAAPWVARRWPELGRALFLLAGNGNVVLMTWALGPDSAVEIFFVPCAVIAGLLFRRGEGLWRLALVGLPLGLFFLLRDRYPPAWHAYSAAEYAGLRGLNAASLAGFAGLIGLVFGGLLARVPKA